MLNNIKHYSKLPFILLFTILFVGCDNIDSQPNSGTSDGQLLSYAYFINDTLNHSAPTHLSISEVLALNCSAIACHSATSNNGGTFKVYGLPLDTDQKNISNFRSAQAHVFKGIQDTSPTVTTNNYPQAHSSPLLRKPLSILAGGEIHKGNNAIDLFTAVSETTNNAGGNDYGEIYRWIAFDQP